VARQRLEAAGIPVYLNGALATGPITGPGADGTAIKLEVREEDLERARELLTAGPADEGEDEEPYDPESAENLALRAWRGALIGLITLPFILHVYSLWLLVKLANHPEEVSPAGMRRVYGALAIDGFVLVGVALIIRSMAR